MVRSYIWKKPARKLHKNGITISARSLVTGEVREVFIDGGPDGITWIAAERKFIMVVSDGYGIEDDFHMETATFTFYSGPMHFKCTRAFTKDKKEILRQRMCYCNEIYVKRVELSERAH
jgi:hypothetical protein